MSLRSRSCIILCGMLIHSAIVARGSLVPLFPGQIGDLRLAAEEDPDVSDALPAAWRRLRVGPLPSLTELTESPQRKRAARTLPDEAGPLQAAPKSVVYTYTFPGSPGSGLAADQPVTAPAFTIFGDWTRVGVTVDTTANAFGSTGWNTSSSINRAQYASFTITSAPGFVLILQGFSFDESRTGGGPTKGEVELFTNGTLDQVFDYNPSLLVAPGQFKTFTWNLTPTTAADAVTNAEFRFVAWNTGNASSSLIFDNVAVTLDVVPEVDAGLAAALFGALIAAHSLIRKRGKQQA